jgi:hypothetical protein
VELVLVILLVGVVIGYARGGRLSYLEHAPIRFIVLIILGFTLRFLSESPDAFSSGILASIPNGPAVANILGFFCVLGFCLANLRLPGMRLGSIGAILNTLTVVVNGGKMPFQIAWAERVGSARTLIANARAGAPHIPDTYSAPLWFFGDWIPAPGLHLTKLVSIGDILVFIGVAYLIEELMVAKPPTGEQ